MKLQSFYMIIGLITTFSLTHCTSQTQKNLPQSKLLMTESKATPIWSENTLNTWQNLQDYSVKELSAIEATTTTPDQKAWAKLAAINKKYSKQPKALITKLNEWRSANPAHPGNELIPAESLAAFTQLSPKKIAVLLPQHGVYASSGLLVKEGLLNAYYAHRAQQPDQTIQFYDTSLAPNVATLYQQAIAEGADLIIGPLLKDNVKQLSNEQTISKPTIALNYADNDAPSLSAQFYQFGLLPEDEALALSAKAHINGLRHAFVIAPNNAWGQRMAKTFEQKWQTEGGTITKVWLYANSQNLANELSSQLEAQQTIDSVFVFSQPQMALKIIPLLHNTFAKGVPIYVNSALSANKNALTFKAPERNVISCELPNKKRNDPIDATTQHDRLYAVGQDAYLISQNLSRLNTLPAFPLYGSTGALTLSTNRQIHRNLSCHTINNVPNPTT